jgi:ubiquitin C-terminal hydrolase
MSVFRPPKVLVIHLKRFSSSGSFGISFSKINTKVTIPSDGLDLRPYMDSRSGIAGTSKNIYDLIGIVNHFGTLLGGHYTALVLKKGGWMCMDDSSASRVLPQSVDQSAASGYLLVYHLRS